jgi:hypothetical protein
MLLANDRPLRNKILNIQDVAELLRRAKKTLYSMA